MREKANSLQLPSYAKINLGIEVLARREDGYHEIRTLFQTIALHDTLEFTLIPGDRIVLQGDDPSIPWDERNLIYQAARMLRERYAPPGGVAIKAHKVIPAGAGLGGGSSNAAISLIALNRLWDLKLEKAALTELAASLGADVPFFLTGGLCLGQGRGDLIFPLRELPPLPCVVAFAPYSISTAEIYSLHGERLALTSREQPSRMMEFLERRRFSRLENELEETIFDLYPGLREIKSLLLEEEALISLVSGTGSAVFALFLETEKAQRALEVVSRRTRAVLTETLPRERYRHSIG